MSQARLLSTLLMLLALCAGCAVGPPPSSTDYQDLLTLFADWRTFEQPPLRDGAPDYTAARMSRAHTEWRSYRDRLHAIDPSEWPTEQQVDWHCLLYTSPSPRD